MVFYRKYPEPLQSVLSKDGQHLFHCQGFVIFSLSGICHALCDAVTQN